MSKVKFKNSTEHLVHNMFGRSLILNMIAQTINYDNDILKHTFM